MSTLIILSALLACLQPAISLSPLSNAEIFQLPVLSRAYEQNDWVLRQLNSSEVRETASNVGAVIAEIKPSYVSGLVYVQCETNVTDNMVEDWNTIRSAVRACNPDARFDIEISLNPEPPTKLPFSSADSLRNKMAYLDGLFQPDGWWFDFYSTAQVQRPEWITAAVEYAHSHNQTIGGNVFNDVVPPGSDAVAFVDKPAPNSTDGYGFDFNRTQVAHLKANASSSDTVIIGHTQSNPQNGPTTESCVWINEWSADKKLSYLDYWASQQQPLDFTFMYPVFYPLCPGAYAYDPLTDYQSDGQSEFEGTINLMNKYSNRLDG